MMHIHSLTAAVVVLGLTVARAEATTITFDAQAASAPDIFAVGGLDSPLVIGDATFTGGKLLLHATNAPDETGVYGTASFNVQPPLSSSFTNPIVISFSDPVSGFSVDLVNEEAATFTVVDNLGTSETVTLGTVVPHTFTFADAGITTVDISASTPSTVSPLINWDFAIDNVQYTPSVAPVPEPSSLLLLGSGLTTLVLRRRARRF